METIKNLIEGWEEIEKEEKIEENNCGRSCQECFDNYFGDYRRCCRIGNHPYAEIDCVCNKTFCWSCAATDTRHLPDTLIFSECPHCGHFDFFDV